MPDLSSAYYNQHAPTFFDDTVEVDMTPLYARFLKLLGDRVAILRLTVTVYLSCGPCS
jgi:hypothetical protein